MRAFKAAAIVAALTFAPAALAQAPQTDPLQLAANEDAAIAATALPDTRLTVAVRIGETGPYPFIVDTAAERTVIARDLARRLNLDAAGRARMLSLTSTRNVDQVHVRNVSFRPGVSHNLQAFVLRGENIGAAGVLGIDALRGQRLVLDFQNNTMTVSPSQRRIVAEPGSIVVRGRTRYGQLVLAESSMDGVEVDVVIDSGLQISIGNEALRRLLRSRMASAPVQQVTLNSITGETMNADYAVVREFRISSLRLTNLPVAFANAHVFRRLRLERRPALFLGMDALQAFERVSVDFPNRRASFVLAEAAR